MGGQSSSQTQTSEPPKWQRPFLERGLGYAQDQYSQTAMGQNIAPMAAQTDQALAGIQQRASYNPVTPAAGEYARQSLTGGFLGSNPYLDATFNKAALATQNQLASQFAGSGRNVEASEGLRSQQLNDLATGIYGGAYDAERNRQQQVLGMAPNIAQAQYGDLDRLLGVGQARENYQQQQLDAPGTALDQYLARVTGNMGTTIKTDGGGGNRAAGALGGAMTGYQMFGNPWGAIGGGILGGLG